jgi:di/tricarboxylate transporter
MSTIGYWMLPNTPPAQQQMHFDESQLMSIYRMEERLIQAKLPKTSPLVGESLGHSNLRRKYNLNVVSIERSGRTILSPEPRTILITGDVLTMAGRVENIQDVEPGLFEVLPNKDVKTDYLASENTTVIEALLTPRSSLIGQTLSGVHFRDKYKMNVLAIYRSGKPIRVSLTDLPLQFGDALLLQGPRQQIQVLQSEPDLILLYTDVNASGLNQAKAPLALLIFLGTLLASVFSSFSISEVMLAGGLLMVTLGVISMDQAYQAVEWKTVFLVAGMLPLGTAMTKTGAANLAADGIVQLLGGYGPLILLGGLIILSIALTQVMHGAVVGTIMAPIAIHLAQSLGLEARSFAMGIALATSFAFITPLGHPVNILVMSPGGYKFRDFIKIGLPLTILLVTLILILLPIFWPLTTGG